MRRKLTVHRTLAIVVTLAFALLAPRAAHADDMEDIGLGLAIAAFGGADLTFSVRAAVLAAEQGDGQFEYSLAQGIVAAPQALVFNGALAALQHDGDAEEAFLILHIPATMTTALTVHGFWGVAHPDEDQRLMFLASTVIGINTMWTSFVLGTATEKRNRYGSDVAIPGIYELITTAPGVAVGVHQALRTDRFTAGWVGIAGWSGLLSLHGALFASEVITSDVDEYDMAASPIHNVGIAPASLGPPVEGAPHTPGFIISGAF